MSLARRAKKRDASEPDIVEALESAGFKVWRIDTPCDLLTFRPDKGLQALECKTGRGKKLTVSKDKRRVEQAEFLRITGTPIARTPEEALMVLGATP